MCWLSSQAMLDISAYVLHQTCREMHILKRCMCLHDTHTELIYKSKHTDKYMTECINSLETWVNMIHFCIGSKNLQDVFKGSATEVETNGMVNVRNNACLVILIGLYNQVLFRGQAIFILFLPLYVLIRTGKLMLLICLSC